MGSCGALKLIDTIRNAEMPETNFLKLFSNRIVSDSFMNSISLWGPFKLNKPVCMAKIQEAKEVVYQKLKQQSICIDKSRYNLIFFYENPKSDIYCFYEMSEFM